jgi:hypothetical protein
MRASSSVITKASSCWFSKEPGGRKDPTMSVQPAYRDLQRCGRETPQGITASGVSRNGGALW